MAELATPDLQPIPAEQVPDEVKAAFGAPASSATEPSAQGTPADPVSELDPAGLAELATSKLFDPVAFLASNPDRSKDPSTVQKLADTHNLLRQRGFKLADLPSPKEAAKGVGDIIKGTLKQGYNYLSALAGVPIASFIGEVTGQPTEFQSALSKQGKQQVAEAFSGTESSLTGVTDLAARAAGKVARATGISKPLTEQSAQERVNDFLEAVGLQQQQGKIATGKGEVLSAVGSEEIPALEKAGYPVRPEEVASLAAGDPFALYAFGKGFHAAGKAIPAVVPKTLNVAAAAAGTAATKVAGKALQTAGKLTETGAELATKVADIFPAIGAVTGTVKAGPVGTLAGLAGGDVARRAAVKTAERVSGIGESIGEFGKNIASGEPIAAPYAQAARDILATAPAAVKDLTEGAAFDVGLAAATSETPSETAATTPFGAAFGAVKGVGRLGLKTMQGQLLAPRPWGETKVTPAYGSFPALDNMNAAATTSRPPGQVQRVNAIRSFLKDSGVQAFLAPTPEAAREALLKAGADPAIADAAAKTDGMFAAEVPDASGKPQRIVILNNADAAPHEAFHGIQDVLGENANRVIDALVYSNYDPANWRKIGMDYASRLLGVRLGESDSWQAAVLDRSGWGNAAATEKIFRDAYNKLAGQTGAEPSEANVRALAETLMNDAAGNKADWRSILSPQEAAAEANRYLAREIAAENFDAIFKNLGSALQEGGALPQKLARIAAKTMAFFGGEPLKGTRTENLAIEPRFSVTEATKDLSKAIVPKGTPAEAPAPSPVAPTPRGALPVTPEERKAEATKGNALADELTARNPQLAEVLRKISVAIANGSGLKIDYRSAGGTGPGASLDVSRESRRDAIEAFRDMPEDVRPLWEKLTFPDKIEATKTKGLQILGWSPENYAANAHRLAKWASGSPEARKLIPYEIDVAKGTFTPEAWREIYDDIQKYVQNQQAGGTGSGETLRLPPDAGALNLRLPAPNPSGLVSLDQARADFHNLLFGIAPPETVRASRKGGTPGNVVAQKIAAANEPFIGPRVSEPGRPRGKGKTFPTGESIKEVNPLRAELERTAEFDKRPMPEMIEVNQRLNLEHIADVTPVEGAPNVRAVTDIVRAGFLPAEIEGKPADEIARTVLAMDNSAWRTFTSGKIEEGGLTGIAYKLGDSLKGNADALSQLKIAGDLAKTQSSELIKAKDFQGAMDAATKSQFFREAVEKATNAGSAKDVQFAPRTEAGKALEKEGYEFVTDGGPGNRSVLIRKAGEKKFLGHLSSFNAEGTPESEVHIGDVVIEPEFRNKGIGTALYRELFSQLQEDGTKAVTGGIVASEPISIREKLLGEGATTYRKGTSRGKVLTPAEAIEEADYHRMTAMQHGSGVRAKSKITPEMQFAPPSEDVKKSGKEFINEAALRDSATGKIFTGFIHSDAYEKAVSEAPGKKAIEKMRWAQNLEDGFTTSTGRFVGRDEALEIGKAAQQIDEAAFKKAKRAVLGEFATDESHPGLDAMAFEKTRQFAPKKGESDFKFKPSSDMTSKGWILPSGQPQQLGAQWHHSWLAENAPELSKKYGIPEKDLTSPDVDVSRTAALRKGFARMNYERNSGRFSVEARAADWRKIKGAVQKVIETNLDSIDKISVTLFNENVKKVVDSDSAAIFNLDTDAEKLAAIPFITGSEPRVQFSPAEQRVPAVEKVAEDYMKSADVPFKPVRDYAPVDVKLAEKLADFYDAAPSTPDDPTVAAAYRALADQTMRQYEAMKDAGYEIEPWTASKGEPYVNSDAMRADVRDNKHLWYFPTEGNFTVDAQKGNALLTDSGLSFNGKRALVNDIFRAVHDFFGHAQTGFEFGPRGEFNAWHAHSEMFSPEAQGALAAETLAQNSWVNFGKHLRGESGAVAKKGEPGYVPATERPFAEQKNLIVPDELIDEARAQFAPAPLPETEGLPGMEVGREFQGAAIAKMTQAELKAHFPEAVVPRAWNDTIPSEITKSPLYKRAGSEEVAVAEFAKRLVDFARENEASPEYQAGQKWYSDFVPKLKKQFGKDAQLFAELLAATSPQTNPTVNFGYAYDAYLGLKEGRFDKIITKFNEGLEKLADGSWEKYYDKELKAGRIFGAPKEPTPAAFLANWIGRFDLKPLQSNGKLYGSHSIPVLQVLARIWLDKNKGPKTANFVENLVGKSHEATIDVWADRTMRRIGYSDSTERWRILPGNSMGVSDADFAFSQKAFRAAANELGIKPDDLQGALWFAEKKLWSDKGWGRLDLGDYRNEIKKIPLLKQGYEHRTETAKAEKKAKPVAEQDLFDIQPRKK